MLDRRKFTVSVSNANAGGTVAVRCTQPSGRLSVYAWSKLQDLVKALREAAHIPHVPGADKSRSGYSKPLKTPAPLMPDDIFILAGLLN